MAEDAEVTINVIANDTNVDGNPLVAELVAVAKVPTCRLLASRARLAQRIGANVVAVARDFLGEQSLERRRYDGSEKLGYGARHRRGADADLRVGDLAVYLHRRGQADELRFLRFRRQFKGQGFRSEVYTPGPRHPHTAGVDQDGVLGQHPLLQIEAPDRAIYLGRQSRIHRGNQSNK